MIFTRCLQLHAFILAIFAFVLFEKASAFSPLATPTRSGTRTLKSNVIFPTTQHERKSGLHLFRRKRDGDGDENGSEEKSTNVSDETDSEKSSPMFFARLIGRKSKKDADVTTSTETTSTTSSTLNASSSASVSPEVKEPVQIIKEEALTPLEKAEALRAQAQRTRLEAEKMDLMLTMSKIEKLEIEINSKAVSEDQEREEELKDQIKSLKKKLETDTSDGKVKESNSDDSDVVPLLKKDLGSVLSSVVGEARALESEDSDLDGAMTMGEIQEKIEKFNAAPQYMRELVVKAAGMDTENLNTTELVLKVYADEKGAKVAEAAETMPEFTQDQIDEVLEAVKMVPQFVKNLYGDDMKNNDTAIAIMMLEEEYNSGNLVVMPEITQKMIDDKLVEYSWVPQFLRGENDTELAIELIKSDFRRNGANSMKLPSPKDVKSPKKITETETSDDDSDSSSSLFGGFGMNQKSKSDKDQMVESLFPESTRKEGEEIGEGQAVLFMSEVLAKDNTWAANSAPEKVSGGFIVRGSTRYETGAELMDAIDTNLEKSRVKSQVNCFYVFDPSPVTEEQMDAGDRPPVLFITGPNVVRDPAPIQRSIISAFAFGTIWYNSLLPFLLNDKYMKLADEQLALADASMSSNVDFLNDLSFPLFAATVGIQTVHEIAHLIVASNNDMNITIPTLVPSIGTGLSGGITSLQSPPKNKQALFDFAIVGPLAGMTVSAVLLFIGMTATNSMDAAAYGDLPRLPLDLLRQSSLVGGIIDSISPGLLTVPDASLGTKAIQEINIPLHPFAIAGYFGMMINAVNLLPVGRTDGGRIGLALFGRSGTQLVSFLTLAFMFFQGIGGSDLLLFFFSFVIFFQSELEIPQRNEVDDMDFSRVLLATATGVLVLLTLIPM